MSTEDLIDTYTLVQFSVHIAGFLGEFGPENVSPHRNPLHAFICKCNISSLFHQARVISNIY
jgi:hypothetical protein